MNEGRKLKNTKRKRGVKKGNVLQETWRLGFLFSKGDFECNGVMKGGCRDGCERHNVQL